MDENGTYQIDRKSLESLYFNRAHEVGISQSLLGRNFEPAYKRLLCDTEYLLGLHDW